MNNDIWKEISVKKIKAAIQQLNKEKKKITQANIIKLSGLSRSTVQRYWKNESPKIKKESPEKKNDSAQPKMDRPKMKEPVSDAFKHFLRRR